MLEFYIELCYNIEINLCKLYTASDYFNFYGILIALPAQISILRWFNKFGVIIDLNLSMIMG